MEKWQCQKLSEFSEAYVFKDPNHLQHWQQQNVTFINECCLLKDDEALKDYDKEVTINTKDIFKKGLENQQYSAEESYNNTWIAHYRMIIPLKSKGNVIIKLTFELSKVEDGVTDQEIENTKKSILNINRIWNGNFTLKVTNIVNHYCPVQLPIKFDVQFAYKGQKIANGERHPHSVELYKIVPAIGKIDRPRLENGQTFILETKRKAYNIPYVYAHEFAHALGLPDEYGYDNIIDSIVQYYKPDGSLDMTKIPAFHQNKSKQKDDPTESIMGVYDSCKITERQGWVLGIAAQKIIDPRRKKYKCDIIFNGTTKPCNF